MTQQPDIATETWTTRPLAADDLEPVIALDMAISGVSRRGFFANRLKAALEKPRDYVYVGLASGDRLIGFAMARLIEGDFGKPGARAVLDAITVAPAYQSHGAGHRLLAALKDILGHKMVGELESQVDWQDRALLRFLGDNGFELAPRIVLTRGTEGLPRPEVLPPDDDDLEIDHSAPEGDETGALSHDLIPVRSMDTTDLRAIVRIDAKLSGAARTAYFERLQHEVAHVSGVRVSMVAESDGFVVGFIMARVDFGEFGRAIPEAALDALGVDPGFQGQGVGSALMAELLSGLALLRVEKLRTEVAWNDVENIAFFSRAGFNPAQGIALKCAL